MFNSGETHNMGPHTITNATIAVAALSLIAAIALMSTSAAYSANPSAAKANQQVSLTSPQVIHALHSDTSLPLRSMPRPVMPPGESQLDEREVENPVRLKNPPPMFAPVDSVVQRHFGALAMPTPGLTFEGYSQQDNYNLNNGLGSVPPDTDGDVGPNHYVQWVNTGIRMFDKSGNTVFGPVTGNSLWSGFPGTCTANNMGDPVVLYDPLADRWLMSQFSVPSRNGGPSYECIAISTSPDPTGSYYRYEFQTSATYFEDYPHLGVWPDAYYMATHEFSSPVTYAGEGNFAFDRAKMLVGDPSATMQYFHLDATHFGILPSDLDGSTPPPAGSPNVFVEFADNAEGAPQDQLQLYKFHVDWAVPANSTFTGPTILPTAPFDSQLCTAERSACVPQPGTTQALEGMNDRLMFRLAYRNFGDHEAAVLNHTVDADGAGLAGVRWYELRNLSGTPTIYQQGTFAPDAIHRWMGSIAMDRSGNIAVGYSASSSSLFPSIRYAGRLATDPLGILGQGEATMHPGGGSQTGYARWGDYSAMSVDPVDDCTFWFTTEYFATTNDGAWNTRIGRFRFPSCVAGATATPTPTITGTPPTATATRTITRTPTITSTPLCAVFTGSITSGDPAQTGRLLRNQGASACGVTRACPGISDALPYHYDAYTFVNSSISPACVVAQLDQTGCPLLLFSAAYLGSFNPNNICANYLGDIGASAAPAYQFTVPAGATFVIVVHEVTPDTGCASYTLTVNGVGTCPITPTPLGTNTFTPTRTFTPTSLPTDTNTPTQPTGTNTPTFTTTGTRTPTGTSTPLACGQSYLLTEGFESGTLGVFTETTLIGNAHWTAATSAPNSGLYSAFAPNTDEGVPSDQQLILVNPVAIPAGVAQAQLLFSHRYSFENAQDPWDGGVLELSTNGGTTWSDAGPNITSGGYTDVITVTSGNPLAGRQAWAHQSPGYPNFTGVAVDLSPFGGQSVKFRFRLGSDLNTGAPGWWIDDVYVLIAGPCPATFTPVPTNTPIPSGSLVGHVTWQGRPAQPHPFQQLPITLTLKSGVTEVNYPSQMTDASGRFTVTTGLASGTYSYRVKDPKYLANSGTLTLASGMNNQEMGLMRAGDATDDNVITVGDFNILKGTFGRGVGQPGYDDRADWTGDQVVNVSDFNWLKVNFGTAGAPPIGPRSR